MSITWANPRSQFLSCSNRLLLAAFISVLQAHYDWQGCISFAFKSGIQWHGFFTHKKEPYFWSVRTISVRNIAEVDIAKQVIEVVSRYLSKKIHIIKMFLSLLEL